MTWQDIALAGLLASGMVATWQTVFNGDTQVPRSASMNKAATSLGLALVQASLGLWITTGVSLSYAAAHGALAVWRQVPPTPQVEW